MTKLNAPTPTVLRLAEPISLLRLDASVEGQEDAQDRFEQLLSQQYANTVTMQLTSPRELLMDAAGLVQRRYRWTAPALSQLCAILSPGLSQTIRSIAGPGAYSHKTDAQSGYQPALAISILNALIRLRFEKLDGYQLVIDENLRQIAGLVGRRYAFIPNLDFYERIKDFVSGELAGFEFQAAAVQGRRLAVRYKAVEPCIRIDQAPYLDEQFCAGVHFDNSETGDCSIKMAVAVIRNGWETAFLSGFTGGYKLPHVRGKRFERKLAAILARIQLLAERTHKLQPAIVRSMGRRLGLGSATDSHTKAVVLLRRKLQKLGLRADFVSEVVDRMLLFGSYSTDVARTRQHPMDVYATRTMFDLYNALSFRAKFVSLDNQERAEQLAYALLAGRISLPK